jgi:hypothetical protein
MMYQNRATDDPAASGMDHDYTGFSNRAGMTDPSHVPAGAGTFLYTGNMGMTGSGMGRTCVGSVR